jgi:hypothetical protein
MSQDTPTEIAAAALKKLEEMHISFMQSIASLKTREVNGGELATDGQNLVVTCLGIQFNVPHRPIAREEALCALEYPFMARLRDREIVVWRMFLEPDNDLYAKPDRQDRICSSGNTYLATKLIEPLASALLRSPLFAPLQ